MQCAAVLKRSLLCALMACPMVACDESKPLDGESDAATSALNDGGAPEQMPSTDAGDARAPDPKDASAAEASLDASAPADALSAA